MAPAQVGLRAVDQPRQPVEGASRAGAQPPCAPRRVGKPPQAVYLSSTADLFLTGLGRGVQLPLALGLLSAAGVLLGTLLRVRAFLLLR